MKKEIIKSTTFWIAINLIPYLIYLLLYALGITTPYELEEDYAANFYLYTLDFSLSLVVILAISLVAEFK